MKLSPFGLQLQHESLKNLYNLVFFDLRVKTHHSGEGAVKPFIYIQVRDGLIFDWHNGCGQRYGSYEELWSIVAAVRLVTIDPAILPEVDQYRETQFRVYLREPETPYVGFGVFQSIPPGGIEVE